jgi:hypothetical protein
LKRAPLWISAGLLTVAGLGLMLYKVVAFGFPLRPAEESRLWTVQARFTVDSSTRPVKVVLKIPFEPPGFAILDENFVSRGFGLSLVEEEDTREAQWAIREAAGRQTFYYRATVTLDQGRETGMGDPGPVEVTSLGEPHDTAVQTIVAQAKAQSADVRSFTSEILRRLNDTDPDENTELLLSSGSSPGRRAQLAVALLASGGVSSRVVYGLPLRDGERQAHFEPFVEVWEGTRWEWFDPATGDEGLPGDLFLWWRGEEPLIDVVGGFNPEVEISSWRNVVSTLELAEQRADLEHSAVMDYSLLSLPIQTQSVYKVLLLIPVGAFFMVLMRNVIGVTTVGTFLPVLIALAFRETRLLAGLVLFVSLVGIGVALRFLLDRLRLLMVPRLAAVLVIVVLCLLVISVLSHRLGLETGLSVALFPIVILTIAIERVSIVWEEVGGKEAFVQGLGTLLVAAVAYLVMGMDIVEYLVFVYPELLLVVLAGILVLGRYRGYRLLELRRFRDVGQVDA